MRNTYRTTGLFVLALMAVYSFGAGSLRGADAAGGNDVFDSTTQPAAGDAAVVASGPPPQITPADGGTFDMHINNDVSISEVLRMIGGQAHVTIVPSKEVRGTVPAMDLYSVTVPEALEAILTSNGFGYEQKGNIVYVFSDKELADRKKLDLETDVYRLYYINADDAMKVVKPALSEEGKVSSTPASSTGTGSGTAGAGSSAGGSSSGGSSGGSGGSSTGGSSGGGGATIGGNSYAAGDLIVVTDHPENQERVRQVVKELDRRPRQVLVESTILESELTENNSLGVNFTALGSINFADLGSIPGSINAAPITPASLALAKQGYNNIETGAGGLQVGIVQNNIALFLSALEGVSNTTVLSNPKVLTLDKQPGYVHIGETIYYTGQTTQNDQTTTSQVSSIATGITLTFRPYIADDGYIRMEIDPNDSTASGAVTTTSNGTVLPPNINNNEVSSNIMVKDGQTVLIGGLFKDNNKVGKNQVPLLGNMPLVGNLFGMQNDSTDRQEIIFLLTPHQVKDDQLFDELSQKEMQEAEKLRVGVRRGMLPYGRERLAEACYENAEAELAKPNPNLDLVRWNLDSATNLNPTFLEAINLKEKVTGKVVTSVDNSDVRSFIQREMLGESKRGTGAPDEIPPKQVKVIIVRPPLVGATLPSPNK